MDQARNPILTKVQFILFVPLLFIHFVLGELGAIQKPGKVANWLFIVILFSEMVVFMVFVIYLIFEWIPMWIRQLVQTYPM